MEIAANQKNYRMKQSWRQASMQIFFLVGANRLSPGHHFEAYLRTSGESNPPVVCPRRQERRPTNYSTGTPQASMQVLNSSVARPWKLEQNTSGQASRQALRASRLWKLKQNNMTKKGPFFGPQNVKKKQARKGGPPQYIGFAHRLFWCKTRRDQRMRQL